MLGCNVVLGDLKPPKQYKQDAVFSSIKIHYHHCDVTSWQSVKGLYDRALELYGSVDIVVANAGVNEEAGAFYASNKSEPNLAPIDVNIKGTFYTALLGMQYMQENNHGGRIVLTSSMAGYFPQFGLPLYTASKSALLGFLRVMAVDCFPRGIAVSAVCPGLTRTSMIQTLLDKKEENVASVEDRLDELFNRFDSVGIPTQLPEVVAKAIVYLAGRGLRVTGQALYVQAGEVIEVEKEVQKSMPKWLVDKMRYMYPDEEKWGELSGATKASKHSKAGKL
ncbi:hypothetical protein CDV31_013526 [Fusarium ambrosium]|uniref:Uncharacterized protein n=1 Tax=Fusarium ambrosium TaxID=131363 RepID=A0A428T2V6_9HYPO|nr:hypothetical protein CDV31_013526 [Fusarium ambrosium]